MSLELHKVEKVAGKYRVTYKTAKKDVDGNVVMMPTNMADFDNLDHIDEEIAMWQGRITDANIKIARLQQVKIQAQALPIS